MNAAIVRISVAAGAFLLLALLFGRHFFDSAAFGEGTAWLVTILVSLGAGLLSRSLWALLLCVPASLAAYQHVPVEFAFIVALFVGLVTAVLLSVGIVLGRRSEGAWLVGAGLVALCLLAVPWGLYRQLRPYDSRPGAPVLVDVGAGRVGGILLSERVEAVREQLGEPVDSDMSHLPENVFPDGYLDYESLTIDHDGGRVFAIETRDRRFQTADGVGVGDSMAFARRQYPGLYCERDGFRSLACAARDGENILFLDGDPIHTLVVSSAPCWPDVSGLGEDDQGQCPQAQRFLRSPRS